MKKKRLPLAILTLLAVFLVWLARPLKSREWDIDFDPDLQSGKDEYLTSLSRNSTAAGRPNVVVILADDLGLTDLSFYGSPHLDTPNIDSIGEDGLAFSQAYATAPICSPSRAGLLTGRYQNRYGFDSQPMNRYARSRLEYWGARLFVDTYPMFPINNPSIPHPDQILRQGIPPTEIILSEALSSAGY
ncbi:MAG: sulfatase-like hydrolase/transferase, partial [Spirochaetaceae bacterium]|nr:sulfatase-like hydrolase/transferase [Spirochaetaceae bacterium]